jgi:hypothetical protein
VFQGKGSSFAHAKAGTHTGRATSLRTSHLTLVHLFFEPGICFFLLLKMFWGGGFKENDGKVCI